MKSNKHIYLSGRKIKKHPTLSQILAKQYQQAIKKMESKENYNG